MTQRSLDDLAMSARADDHAAFHKLREHFVATYPGNPEVIDDVLAVALVKWEPGSIPFEAFVKQRVRYKARNFAADVIGRPLKRREGREDGTIRAVKPKRGTITDRYGSNGAIRLTAREDGELVNARNRTGGTRYGVADLPSLRAEIDSRDFAVTEPLDPEQHPGGADLVDADLSEARELTSNVIPVVFLTVDAIVAGEVTEEEGMFYVAQLDEYWSYREIEDDGGPSKATAQRIIKRVEAVLKRRVLAPREERVRLTLAEKEAALRQGFQEAASFRRAMGLSRDDPRVVIHIDGDLENTDPANLKIVHPDGGSLYRFHVGAPDEPAVIRWNDQGLETALAEVQEEFPNLQFRMVSSESCPREAFEARAKHIERMFGPKEIVNPKRKWERSLRR